MGIGAVLAACSGEPEPSADAGREGGPPAAGDPPVEPPVGLWVRSFESTGDEDVRLVSPRPDGSFVVWGTYQGPATFSPGQPDEELVAMPDGASEEVLVHYAPDGSLRALTVDPLGGGGGRLHVDRDGSVYVTGTGDFQAGSVTVPSDADVYVAKYDADGSPQWAASASGDAGMGAGTAVAAWEDGSVVIAGSFEGTITFGVGEPTETRLASTSEEIFLARYGATGALLWAKRVIAAPYLPAWKLAAMPDGGIALYGVIENRTTINPDLADETELLGGNIGFMVKLDSDGAVEWTRTLDQAEGANRISDLAAFPDGSIVVTGSFERMFMLGLGTPAETTLAATGSDFPGRTQFPDFFAARFDAEGELVWARREGGGVWDGGSQAEALDDGATLIAGSYTNDVTFAAGEPAETTLSTEPNDSVAFVTVINADGSVRWVRQAPDGQVAPLSDGSVVIASSFMGTVTVFPGEVGEKTLASAGRWDVYVARMGWGERAP